MLFPLLFLLSFAEICREANPTSLLLTTHIETHAQKNKKRNLNKRRHGRRTKKKGKKRDDDGDRPFHHDFFPPSRSESDGMESRGVVPMK